MNESSPVTSMLRRYLSLAPLQLAMVLVGLGWLGFVNLQVVRYLVERDQRTWNHIDRMWSVVVAPTASKGNVDRNQAIAFLHKHGQSFQLVDLRGAMLKAANLSGAKLRMANLENAVLQDANLRGANLWGADLTGARLSDATLRDANLKHARLVRARLDNADLRGGDLTQADVTGADLRGARVRWQQLAEACGDPGTPPVVDERVRPPAPWPRPCEPLRSARRTSRRLAARP